MSKKKIATAAVQKLLTFTLTTGVVIAIGLLPLSVWLFAQYSLLSFVANTIAIPWVGFLILPFCFLARFAPNVVRK